MIDIDDDWRGGGERREEEERGDARRSLYVLGGVVWVGE